jgi:hypothetical protein
MHLQSPYGCAAGPHEFDVDLSSPMSCDGLGLLGSSQSLSIHGFRTNLGGSALCFIGKTSNQACSFLWERK